MYGDFASQEKRRSQENKSQVIDEQKSFFSFWELYELVELYLLFNEIMWRKQESVENGNNTDDQL